MGKPWTTLEEANVRKVHASGIAYAQMMHLWPGRTHQAITCHASEMGLGERPVPLRRDVSRMLPLVLDEVAKGPVLAYDVADRIGACREWVGRLLRANHASDDPKVQIVRWHRNKKVGPYREVWALGNGESVEYPKALSRSERKRLARAASHAAASSPFSVAAGLTAVPVSRAGRVIKNLDLHDRDREAA